MLQLEKCSAKNLYKTLYKFKDLYKGESDIKTLCECVLPMVDQKFITLTMCITQSAKHTNRHATVIRYLPINTCFQPLPGGRFADQIFIKIFLNSAIV